MTPEDRQFDGTMGNGGAESSPDGPDTTREPDPRGVDPAPPPATELDEHRAYASEDAERPSLKYWSIVGQQFRKNRLSVFSLYILAFLYVLAVYSPFISFSRPFIYVDTLRQTLREGDKVEIGSVTFEVSGEDIEARRRSPAKSEGTRKAARTIRAFFLTRTEEDKKTRIRQRLRVGSSTKCDISISDGNMAEKHALFGIARGRPFVADTSGERTIHVNGELIGETDFPFFRSLFNEIEFEMSVDRFFNSMIFLLPPLLLLYLFLRKIFRIGVGTARAVTLVLLLGSFGAAFYWINWFPLSEPYRDYRVELLEDGADLTRPSPLVKGKFRWGFFPPIRRTYRDQIPRIYGKDPHDVVKKSDFLSKYTRDPQILDSAGTEKISILGLSYICGTDNQGRDVFSRLLYGTRISLTIGVFAVAIYVAIGIILGGLAGFFGGWVDMLIMRIIEIMMCFPSFFLILTIISVLESRSIFWIMLVIGITRWTGVARLIRGEFLKQKSIDYVTAAQALGVGRTKIMFKHILPNAIAPVLVAATFGIAAAILTEASLSFLGLGDPRAPSWGQILTAGRASQEMYLILLPGFAIFFTVTILNLVGEGVRDALDPKLRQ